MTSHANDGHDRANAHPKDVEANMFGSIQSLEQTNLERDEEPQQGIVNDEDTLSPASKKLLENCAVSMPPPNSNRSLKAGPSIIARPDKMEPDFPGFTFAKPTQSTASFSCRSRPVSSSEIHKIASGEKNLGVVGQEHESTNGRSR